MSLPTSTIRCALILNDPGRAVIDKHEARCELEVGVDQSPARLGLQEAHCNNTAIVATTTKRHAYVDALTVRAHDVVFEEQRTVSAMERSHKCGGICVFLLVYLGRGDQRERERETEREREEEKEK